MKRLQAILICTLIVGVWNVTSATSAAPASDDPTSMEKVEAVQAEYDDVMARWEKLYRMASDKGKEVVLAKRPKIDYSAAKIFAIVDEDPGSDAALAGLKWVLRKSQSGKSMGTAFDLLARDHLYSRQLGDLCQKLQYTTAANAPDFLRALMEQSPHRSVRASACYTLSKNLQFEAGIARQIDDGGDSERLRLLVDSYGEEVLERLRDTDPDALIAEVEKVLERVIADFGDMEHPSKGSLAKAAERDLFDIRNLAIGKTAPEIVGEDISGTNFKLSDYRGKVVVLDFWGNW